MHLRLSWWVSDGDHKVLIFVRWGHGVKPGMLFAYVPVPSNYAAEAEAIGGTSRGGAEAEAAIAVAAAEAEAKLAATMDVVN